MKCFAVSLLAIFLIFLPVAQASGPCEMSHGVTGGEQVPCDGVLLPQAWALRSIQCVDAELPACEKQQELVAGLADSCRKTLYSVTRACDDTLARCESIAREAAGINRPWYDSNLLWFAVGMVATAGTVAIITD